MVNRVILTLDQQEYSALLEIAGHELRNPSDQARILLRQQLKKFDVLEDDSKSQQEGSNSEQQ
jgi:hypothetical protein